MNGKSISSIIIVVGLVAVVVGRMAKKGRTKQNNPDDRKIKPIFTREVNKLEEEDDFDDSDDDLVQIGEEF